MGRARGFSKSKKHCLTMSNNPPIKLSASSKIFATGAILFFFAAQAVIFFKVPWSMPTPIYYEDALRLLEGRQITENFVPIGYTALVFSALKIGGVQALFFAQSGIALMSLAAAFFLLRLYRVTVSWSLITAGCLALHPYLIINTKKVVDSNLSALLLIFFVIVIIKIYRTQRLYLVSLIAGILFAGMILVRPNYFLFAPLIFWSFLRLKTAFKAKCTALAVLTAGFLSTCFLISVPLTGKLLIVPENGAYNLLAGANHHTKQILREDYNPERSLWILMEEEKIKKGNSEIYRDRALQYIQQNPWDYFKLCALKVINFFRPDYRSLRGIQDDRLIAGLGVMQTILALPIFFWLLVKWISLKKFGFWDETGLVPVLILYLLPFVLLISDPRFRLPFDFLLIIHLGFYADRYFLSGARATRGEVKT